MRELTDEKLREKKDEILFSGLIDAVSKELAEAIGHLRLAKDMAFHSFEGAMGMADECLGRANTLRKEAHSLKSGQCSWCAHQLYSFIQKPVSDETGRLETPHLNAPCASSES